MKRSAVRTLEKKVRFNLSEKRERGCFGQLQNILLSHRQGGQEEYFASQQSKQKVNHVWLIF